MVDILDPEIIGSNDHEDDDNPMDAGAILFENQEVLGTTEEAIKQARKDGIIISEHDREQALSIFPAVMLLFSINSLHR
jgi:hypothetical protein